MDRDPGPLIPGSRSPKNRPGSRNPGNRDPGIDNPRKRLNTLNEFVDTLLHFLFSDNFYFYSAGAGTARLLIKSKNCLKNIQNCINKLIECLSRYL